MSAAPCFDHFGDDFSAVCWWEVFAMIWGHLGEEASRDIQWHRAESTVARLEAARAVVAPARPSLAEIKRQVAETVACQARTVGNALRVQDQAAFDAFVRATVNNVAQLVGGMLNECLGEEQS